MSNFIVLTVAFVFFLTHQHTECTTITGPQNDTIGEKDKNIVLKFQLNNMQITSVVYFYFNEKIEHEHFAGFAYFLVPTKNEDMEIPSTNVPFTKRVSGNYSIINGFGTCEIKINQLRYEDAGYIITEYGGLGKVLATDRFYFNVEGGPELCSNQDLPQNITTNVGDYVRGSITLCGKPQPELTWYLGDIEINGTIDDSMKDQHNYTYSFSLLATKEMRGKDISYRAKGFKPQEITGKTTILMKPKPPPDDSLSSWKSWKTAVIVIIVLVVITIVIIGILYYRGFIGNRKLKEKEIPNPEEETPMNLSA